MYVPGVQHKNAVTSVSFLEMKYATIKLRKSIITSEINVDAM